MGRSSPAGYCLPPTAELPRRSTGPISTSGPSISLFTEPGDSCGQINPFRLTRCRSPVDRSLMARAARRQWLQVCLPDGYQPQCLSSRCYNRAMTENYQQQDSRSRITYGVPGTQGRVVRGRGGRQVRDHGQNGQGWGAGEAEPDAKRAPLSKRLLADLHRGTVKTRGAMLPSSGACP